MDQAVHYKATIEYDGTDFLGFQVQPDGRTVQGELQAALARLNHGQPVKVRGAGRTDSGVHATGQVVDFFLAWHHGDAVLLRALNAILPPDVAVRELERAPEGFHPRFSATSRVYRYTIWNAPQRSPLARRTSLHVAEPLDEAAMAAALQFLLGEYDFASFGQPTQGESTVRRLLRATVSRNGPWLYVELEATGFLYRMVRRIVGSLLLVGRGERPPEWLREVLLARDPAAARPSVAPVGLCLTAVRYDKGSGPRDQVRCRSLNKDP